MTIYTVGHSTRTLDEFLRLLQQYSIRCVVDVRRFPSSKKFPHFNRDELEKSLPQNGIQYMWMESLGGRRHGKTDPHSPNIGLRSPAFRNYADYMQTEDFGKTISALMTVAKTCPTAIMCAERLYFRCHRMLISDYLKMTQVGVYHIGTSVSEENDSPVPHVYTSCAKVDNGKLTYPSL